MSNLLRLGLTGYTIDHWTSLRIDAIPIPREADRDIVEKWGIREFGTLEDNINTGDLRHMYGTDPTNSQKFEISWSCSQSIRMPVLSKIFRGKLCTVVPIFPLEDVIEPGATLVTLCRDPADGIVVLFDDLLGEDELIEGVDFTVAGRVVALAAPRAGRIIVSFRPVLSMIIDKWSFTWNERTCVASWDLEAREV